MKKNKYLALIIIFGAISAIFVTSLINTAVKTGLTTAAIPGIILMSPFIGLFVLFIVLRVKYLKEHADEIRAENEAHKQKVQAENAEKAAEKAYLAQFKSTRSAAGISIDEVHKLISIPGFTNKIYRYTDIAGYDVLRREQTSTKGHSVGRAVVGGAVAGVVGAAVGAASGLETKTNTLLAVDISYSNGGHQTVYILNSDKPVSNAVFVDCERKLNKVVAMLDTVINENNAQ